MSFVHFIRILLRNIKWLLVIPFIIAFSIFYFTRYEKKIYSSESVIYTGIASGYNLSGYSKSDYFATSNAFDNLLSIINSRDTKEQVAVELLSNHLFLKKLDLSILSWGANDALSKIIPDSVREKLVKPTLDETIHTVNNFMQANDTNLIYKLINSGRNPFYSVEALQEIKAIRISSSDLIKISYETNDAAICKHTLELLIATFIKKQKLLRVTQTDSVVAYFEKGTLSAFKKLDSIEQVFLDFNRQNDIINFNEQTKAITEEKQNINTLDHTLQMNQLASGSALNKVNDNIKGRIYQTIYGSEIMAEREKLSDVYNKIAVVEVIGQNNISDGQKKYVDSLRSVSVAIEKNLKTSIDKLYIQSNTPNGIPTKSVLDEWLKTTLAFEESKARLSAMGKRKKDFNEEFKKLAPIGAILKKIERKITVAEQEYLEMLHGLNQARLTQQNNELTSKLTILDPPYLPLKPNPSKRLLQIVLGFFAGFILVLAIILADTLINQTLQEPIRARKLIGLPIACIYPLTNSSPEFLARANRRLLQQVLLQVNDKEKPSVIGIISIQRGEGKSTIANIWKQELTHFGFPVKITAWQKDYRYNEQEGVVLLELPALEDMVLTNNMLPEAIPVFLVCRANRIWNKMDRDLLAIFRKSVSITPLVILNGVETDFAEEYIGEAPKKRTSIRALIKRLLKFEFGSRKIIR